MVSTPLPLLHEDAFEHQVPYETYLPTGLLSSNVDDLSYLGIRSGFLTQTDRETDRYVVLKEGT